MRRHPATIRWGDVETVQLPTALVFVPPAIGTRDLVRADVAQPMVWTIQLLADFDGGAWGGIGGSVAITWSVRIGVGSASRTIVLVDVAPGPTWPQVQRSVSAPAQSIAVSASLVSQALLLVPTAPVAVSALAAPQGVIVDGGMIG